jgi:hypothetical protein
MCFTDFYALDTPMDLADYSTLNGYLRVRCINPFAGTLCGQEIKVIVMAAAGDNMEFAQPVDNVVIEGELNYWGADIDISNVLQSGTVGADAPSMLSIALVPPTGEYPVSDILCGERILSVRALMQKPSPCWDGPAPVYETTRSLNHNPFRARDPLNYMNYFGTMFLAFAGSIRYKYIVVEDDSDLHEALWISPSLSFGGSMPLAQVNPTTNGMLVTTEVTVPYYHNEKFVPAYKNTVLRDEMTTATMAVGSSLNQEVLYKCAGPDMRLTTFRAQHKWVFVTDDGYFPAISVFSEAEYVHDAPAALSALRTTAEKTARPARAEITLDQYRARTGRRAFKETRRTKNRRVVFAPSPPQTTEDQAIRELTFGLVPLSSGA